MASTYENDLRLEEMATGENSGSWGTKTNNNLELVADAFSYGTEIIADGDTAITIADGVADAARSLALKITSSEDLTTTRLITLGPNTVSKVWIIENSTSGGQTLTISAGSGANITLANGTTKIIATDGIGAAANVVELTQDIAIADMTVDGILSLADGTNSAPSLTNTGDTNTGLYFPAADEVGLTVGGTQRLNVSATGVDVTGTVTMDGGSTSADFSFGDDVKAIFGAGSDLTIEHNGTNSTITNTTGTLTIQNTADDEDVDIVSDDGSGGTAVYFRADGSSGQVKLFHNDAGTGTLRLNTSSDGIDITGHADIEGHFTATDGCTITTADNSTQLTLTSTDADASEGPRLDLKRDSASPTAGDLIGTIRYLGEDDGGAATVFGEIQLEADDVTDGSEDGEMRLMIRNNGNLRNAVLLGSTDVVFNESGDDVDLRVESNNNANMLFVDAGANYINIGSSVRQDNALLQVTGAKSYSSSYVVRNQIIASDTTALSAGVTGGAIGFNGVYNTGGSTTQFGSVEGLKYNGNSGDYGGEVLIRSRRNGGNNEERASFSSAEIVFNEDSYDTDFRVETDDNANTMFIDGALNRVRFGKNTADSSTSNAVTIGGTLDTSWGASLGFDNDSSGGANGFVIATDSSWGIGSGFGMGFGNASSDNFRVFMNSTETIINERSMDIDFRVESDTNSHMLFVDGTNNQVIVGASSAPNSELGLAVVGASAENIGMKYTGTTGGHHTRLEFIDKRDQVNAIVQNNLINDGVGTAGAHLEFLTAVGGTLSERLKLGGGTTHEAVFNDDDLDYDFRVESDSQANMLVVNAGENSVNIGKSTSAAGTVGFTFSSASMTATVSSGNTYHLYDTAAYKFYVNANGGIYNYSGNNVNLSDQREKKNIEALDSQWDALKQWDLKKFHYKSDDDSDAKKVGVIAQDVQVNHPDLISDFQNTEDETRLAVKEQQMMWMAIKALQEAQAKIETLEAKVTALENA